jgi:hypothetical protein
MLAAQGGRCAICGSTDPRGGDGASFAVDHDHACCPANRRSYGKCLRGLLCHPCNQGLGMFRDDPAVARAAADYLEA